MTSSAEAVRKTKMPVTWQPVGTGDLDALAKARLEAINLVQWLVRIANSFVTANASDEPTELEFRAVGAAFVTKPFEGNLALEMRLPTLEMQFLENGRPMPHILDPEEHSPAEVEAWLLVELLHRGIDHTRFSKKLPYIIPGLLTGDEKDYSPQLCQQGLTQLMVWFQNAAAILDVMARASGRNGGRIICRPQTLDLSYVSNRGSGSADFGFSPGDAQSPEPFFYGNARAPNGKECSILPASKLFEEDDPCAAAITFMQAATG